MVETSTQSYPIWTSKPITIGGLGYEKQEEITQPVPWGNWKPVSASLLVNARQTYSSGATLIIWFNNQNVAELHWGAFETGDKNTSANVVSFLSNGDNKVVGDYYTAYKVITPQYCLLTLVLQVTYECQTGECGDLPTPPPPSEPWPWWYWVAGVGGAIGIITIVGVVAYNERQQLMQMMMLSRGR